MRSAGCRADPNAAAMIPVCCVGSCKICYGVPLLCHLARWDQLQILDI